MIVTNYRFAKFYKRLAAFYLASFFILTATLVVIFLCRKLDVFLYDPTSAKFYIKAILIFFAIAFSDAFFQCLFTANLAKRILGLKIVDYKDDARLGCFKALLRSIVGFVSFAFVGLGFIAAAFNYEKVTLHDLVAGSKVVDTSQGLLSRLVSQIIALLVLIPGLLISLSLFAALVLFPTFAFKSLVFDNYASYDLQYWQTKPERKVKIRTSNDKAIALVYMPQASNLDYIDFGIKPDARLSTIAKEDLQKLEVDILDYKLININQDWQVENFRLAVIPDKVILKSVDDHDITIYDPLLVIAEESSLAKDLLGIFDYSFLNKEQNLELALNKADREIIESEAYDDESKVFLLGHLAKVHKTWLNYLSKLDLEFLEALQELDSTTYNPVSIIYDTQTGYATQAILDPPSKDEVFNKVTRRFFKFLPKLGSVPKDIQKQNTLGFDLELRYYELI